MLTGAMQALITEQRLGFVASVGADGAPNLSPKGTFLVLDAERLAFGEMRSPNTLTNIADRPTVAVNFVNPLSRKGVRLTGQAAFHPKGQADCDDLLPAFTAVWGDLTERFNCVVTITIDSAGPLTTPAYDAGMTEADLRAQWFATIKKMNEGWK
jgi:predicted pyridoxine 5'-phosphate oxidase superfamily flavin-nucleotide-binding protein